MFVLAGSLELKQSCYTRWWCTKHDCAPVFNCEARFSIYVNPNYTVCMFILLTSQIGPLFWTNGKLKPSRIKANFALQTTVLDIKTASKTLRLWKRSDIHKRWKHFNTPIAPRASYTAEKQRWIFQWNGNAGTLKTMRIQNSKYVRTFDSQRTGVSTVAFFASLEGRSSIVYLVADSSDDDTRIQRIFPYWFDYACIAQPRGRREHR